MTQSDSALRRALMEANLAQYETVIRQIETAEPDFSPRYLRERSELLADPWGWMRRRETAGFQWRRRLNWRVIAIVAALLLLSACAAAVVTGQFSQWFPRLGVDPQAPEQSEEVLSRTGTVIEQTKTVGDATVTLHGAVRDEDTLWLSLTVESPHIPEELTPGSPLSYALYTEECYMGFRGDQRREHLETFYAEKGLPPEELEAAVQNVLGEEAPKDRNLNLILLSREGNALTFEAEAGLRLYVERPEITLHLENIAPYEDGKGEGVSHDRDGNRAGPGPGEVFLEGPFDFTFTLEKPILPIRYEGAGVEVTLSGTTFRFTGFDLSVMRLTAFYDSPIGPVLSLLVEAQTPEEERKFDKMLTEIHESVRGLWTEDGTYVDLMDSSSFGGGDSTGRDYPFPMDPAQVTAVNIAGTRVELGELTRLDG